jgi:NIPSNAP
LPGSESGSTIYYVRIAVPGFNRHEGTIMIVDYRTDTMHPGHLGAFFKLYGAEGFSLQRGYLGDPLGYYMVEVGVQHRAIHLWGYRDMADRTQRVAALEADPAWTNYRAKCGQFIARQENMILRHAPFWPFQPAQPGAFGYVDLRSYTLQHGKFAAYLKLYESEGLPIQNQFLGQCLGYYVSDIGALNQVVHFWAYPDLNERARRRQALTNDPAWVTYLGKMTPMMAQMENAIIRPAPFWTPKS